MRTVFSLALVVLLAALCGCTEPLVLNAFVDPPTGHVPYAAHIVCTSLPGTYTYDLPDGTSTRTKDSEIAVTIDELAWTARVTWTDGHQVRVVDVTAQGTNAPPLILAPKLNGDAYQGVMRPREATLIDFTHVTAGLSGPESGVVYDGAWRIVSIRVEAEDKAVCGAIMGDCIYTPPWEEGAFHALYHGQVWENACLVYPLFTAEIASNGRPYAPEALPGYSFDGARNRNLLLGVEFPEQTAVIRVVVEDDWGRETSASFPFKVAATSFWDHVNDGTPDDAPGGADKPTRFKDAVFFVSSPTDAYYYHRNCAEVCGIPGSDRIYFSSEANAEAAGKRRSPSCFGT
jgi:hypothetical protein